MKSHSTKSSINKGGGLIMIKKIIVYGIIAIFLSTNFLNIGKAVVHASSTPSNEYYEESYKKYLEENGYNGKMASSQIDVDIFSYKAEDGMKASEENDGVVTDEQGKITWDFQVKETGFYNIELTYIPIKGNNSAIQRKLYIDNKVLFSGMSQIALKRKWDNNKDGKIVERNGNEIRPAAVEKEEWTTVYIDDSQRRTLQAYKFYLSAGAHSLTFESIKEPVKIGKITFKKEPTVRSYEDAAKEWKQRYKIYEGESIVYQAERIDDNTKAIEKSSQDIVVSTDYSSPNTVPYHPYKIKMNTIGGSSWKLPGDTITWKINVPEEGLYRLSFRGRQNINRGIMSYRKLKINGEVPFSEAMKIGFGFNSGFVNFIPANNNESFLFHLKKGDNTISLETVLGDFAMPLTEVEKSLLVLNELYRKTIQITGVVPDKYIDYEITKKIPRYAEAFKGESERLKKVVQELVNITGEKGEMIAVVEKMQLQAETISSSPENVINELGTLKNNISALGSWVTTISQMPLELDSFTLSSPNSELPKAEANVFTRFYYGAARFLSTFFIDETNISDAAEKDAIKVWTSAGRDQAQIIKNMIDGSFAPKSGIAVDLQLIPNDVILPATLAGNGPDIALNIPQATVMNFAMRNALTDLSKLNGFDEMKKKYYDSALRPVVFKDGIYGLPEQQTFMMMFYRTDILEQLNLQPPRTWDEVENLISVLHANNYDFYLPEASIYPSLVYQYGGDMYKGEGNDYGIESGLIDDNSMEAFNKLTKFFTSYKLPVKVDFSNRFRSGEMPIGIANYTTYNQLEVFAPEIRGLWSFAPVPGVQNADGTINNAVVSDTIDCIMMKSAKDKEKAWEFMKWWLSTDTQLQYASSLESIMGAAARYPTANIEVLDQLPWPLKHSQQLMEQFKSTKGVQEVPGGYMTSRSVDYAFRSAIAGGQNSREALYLNIKDINKELTKKRKEFHLSYKGVN